MRSCERCRREERREEKVAPFQTKFDFRRWDVHLYPREGKPCRLPCERKSSILEQEYEEEEEEGEGSETPTIVTLCRNSASVVCGGCNSALCTCCRGYEDEGEGEGDDGTCSFENERELNPSLRSVRLITLLFWL
jgi:hypothetical protein